MKSSRFIGFRMHPSNEAEREALKHYDELIKQGFSPRQIFTDALLHSKGKTPEMFEGVSRQVTKPYLEDLLADFAAHLIRELRSLSIVVQRESSDTSQATEDEDTEYAKNLAAGYMARRKR